MNQAIHFLNGVEDHERIVNLRIMYNNGDDAYFWALVRDFRFRQHQSINFTAACVPAPLSIGLDDIIAMYAVRYSTVGELKAELLEEGYVIATLV